MKLRLGEFYTEWFGEATEYFFVSNSLLMKPTACLKNAR